MVILIPYVVNVRMKLHLTKYYYVFILKITDYYVIKNLSRGIFEECKKLRDKICKLII